MLHFYKDVLGLPHVGSLPLPGGGVMERLNIGTTVLKLTTRASIPEASNPSGGLEGATGIRYFTITVEDVDGAVELCKGDNAPIVIPAVDFRPGVRIAIVEVSGRRVYQIGQYADFNPGPGRKPCGVPADHSAVNFCFRPAVS